MKKLSHPQGLSMLNFEDDVATIFCIVFLLWSQYIDFLFDPCDLFGQRNKLLLSQLYVSLCVYLFMVWRFNKLSHSQIIFTVEAFSRDLA